MEMEESEGLPAAPIGKKAGTVSEEKRHRKRVEESGNGGAKDITRRVQKTCRDDILEKRVRRGEPTSFQYRHHNGQKGVGRD